MSSTLLVEDTGVPFDELQAEQIAPLPRPRGPRPAGSGSRGCRSAAACCRWSSDLDRQYFGERVRTRTRSVILEGVRARFGKSYVGEPDALAEELAKDAAVREADTLLITVPEHARRRVQRAAAGERRRARGAGHRLGAPRPAP